MARVPGPRPTGWRRSFALFQPFFATRLYQLTLPRNAAPPDGFTPTDMWPGDGNRGAVIVKGDFEFAGQAIREADAPWLAAGISTEWLEAISTFDWLRDLRASGSDAARSRARALVYRWADSHGSWNAIAWQPGPLGARVANWLGHREFLLAGSDLAFQDSYFLSLRRQTRHLQRVAGFAAAGTTRIVVLKGLIYAALTFNNPKLLSRWIRLLQKETDQLILGDGGNLMRNPSQQLAIMRHLIDIRSALRDGQQEVPHWLQTTIDRMAPMLRFFRHGDGGLALFNGSHEEEGLLLDVVLTRSEARGKALESAPHSGFERLVANRTAIIMDVGSAPPPGVDSLAHAGALSFEMSVGKDRLVVNCGAHQGDNAAWIAAQRTTAAHSTVTVEDVNSAQILEKGGFGGRPPTATVDRKEADGDIWIDGTHDGYQRTFGLVHERRLYLSANGGDVRGEDTLTGEGNHKFVVRFHLHPTVRASMVQEGNAVLLRPPTGTGWRFRASGGVVSVQESVYLGQGYDVKRTEQIAVSSATQNGQGQVKWALTQLSAND
ncbi:MAG: hypothetical protein HOM58_20795 [Rhodospirillaceae bacterium]|jgi:uncharacterized heparinase superfamily protein|nr:hypothetical protein [Rhodospirillaceae bacterium]